MALALDPSLRLLRWFAFDIDNRRSEKLQGQKNRKILGRENYLNDP